MFDAARSHARLVACVLAGAMCGCESKGHFSLLGYTTRPNYDDCIRTVYVPTFENSTFVRRLEHDLTRAVIREIELKTPYKVVSDRDRADTELAGAIVNVQKNILNRNQLNEVREGEQVVTVGVVWKDMRTGEILSKPRRTGTTYPTPGIPALEIPDLGVVPGTAPPAAAPPPAPEQPVPVLVTGVGNYVPELGQSNASSYQTAINRLAVQIVSQMERPW